MQSDSIVLLPLNINHRPVYTVVYRGLCINICINMSMLADLINTDKSSIMTLPDLWRLQSLTGGKFTYLQWYRMAFAFFKSASTLGKNVGGGLYGVRPPPRMRDSLECKLTRAPLGYFYNAPHWGGGLFRAPPPSDLRNYWTDSKNSSGIWKPWKNCRGKTNFIDLRVTSDVTGQVKVKMFDISGLVTSASKIAMLSTNKAN